MIFIGALLTGLGLFNKIIRYAGAGLAVPVTGFANSVVASALEFKREGLIFGVGSKMFMLAGSVITFGVATAFLVGLIYALFVF
ncbi:SpoVA/SpoVAEb family sporulation membrane protein [Desulforudis sp. DRI-14]|uniref:SpoVA/SpoVAEb family sporulation membrane protein n=1 Tax=Desulforudis sp. DRI-14 TaxID=3459793 RepID=UPI004042D842